MEKSPHVYESISDISNLLEAAMGLCVSDKSFFQDGKGKYITKAEQGQSRFFKAKEGAMCSHKFPRPGVQLALFTVNMCECHAR